MSDNDDKMQLFDSDEEEEVIDDGDDFKIRPQFQGPHGLQMLEMSAQLSKRFKLDERFAEDFVSEDLQKSDSVATSEVVDEKKKNIRILESILGHEVSTKFAEKGFSKKKLIRFDPDDENASKFVKLPEKISEKPSKSKKKKVVEEKVEEVIPVSTERYIEVCPNLKEILNTSTPFSFSQNFNFPSQETAPSPQIESIHENTKELAILISQDRKEKKTDTYIHKPSVDSFIPKSKYDHFFILEGDPRLKEGIEFFKRPKPLDEIRDEWQKRKEIVMEMFRKKKRSSLRSYSTRAQSAHKTYMARKQNFGK